MSGEKIHRGNEPHRLVRGAPCKDWNPTPIPFTCEIARQLIEPRLVRDTDATVHHLTEVLYFGGDDVAVFEKPL